MFVHKDWQGRGIATRLLAEVEGIARTYGVTVITTEVSLTARSFFEKKGYKVIKEQKCQTNRLRLTNFVMKKFL
jgi:putative acetyltransferase